MRTAGIVLASAVLVGLVGVPASQTSAAELPATSQARSDDAVNWSAPVAADEGNDEPDTSITSTEEPGAVAERAVRVLGDRFVTISVNEGQRSFTVHVLNLDPGEVDELTKSIRGIYPVQLVDAAVPSGEVDRLLEVVEKYAYANPGLIQMFGAAYDRDAVKVVASDEKALSEALEGIRATAGDATRLSPVSKDRIAVSGFAANIVTDTSTLKEQESDTDSPYRAGKMIRINASSYNCTAGFLMKKDGLAYGSTAGHCGMNGSTSWFGGGFRGNVQNNTLWAANPALADASLFRMVSGGTAYVRRSAALEASPVTSTIAATTLTYGTRTCTRGSFTGGERCGNLVDVNVQTYSNIASRYVRNGYCWAWEVAMSTTGGDSGAPVYQIASGNIKAAGMHRTGDGLGTSCFTSITAVMSFTGSTVWTVG